MLRLSQGLSSLTPTLGLDRSLRGVLGIVGCRAAALVSSPPCQEPPGPDNHRRPQTLPSSTPPRGQNHPRSDLLPGFAQAPNESTCRSLDPPHLPSPRRPQRLAVFNLRQGIPGGSRPRSIWGPRESPPSCPLRVPAPSQFTRRDHTQPEFVKEDLGQPGGGGGFYPAVTSLAVGTKVFSGNKE